MYCLGRFYDSRSVDTPRASLLGKGIEPSLLGLCRTLRRRGFTPLAPLALLGLAAPLHGPAAPGAELARLRLRPLLALLGEHLAQVRAGAAWG